MSKYDLITYELLHDLFEYRDGELYWKNHKAPRIRANRLAGTINSNGYRVVRFLDNVYRIHRLIYFMFHKKFPKLVDHINGNKLDNRIENLREATRSENLLNQKRRKNNQSGIKNVSFHTKSQKWRIQFRVNKKNYSYGSFDSLEEAAKVAKQKRNELHKEFARHE